MHSRGRLEASGGGAGKTEWVSWHGELSKGQECLDGLGRNPIMWRWPQLP